MRRLELQEYGPQDWKGSLNGEQIRALTDYARVEVTPSPDEEGAYTLKPSSYVGVAKVGDLAFVVRPKVPIDRVMFLIAYAMDPKNWRSDLAEWSRADDVLEAIALAFTHRTRQAIRRGLLKDYRREEDALNTVRGRIRFDEQIRRRFDFPLPIEVSFDEFTEDIEKNRLLKTAIHRLGHTSIRSEAVGLEVRRLRPYFALVGLGSYQQGTLPEVRYTRLDEHYRPAVELARLIIENSSLELQRGDTVGASFFINMNKVFEQFLYVALGEILGLTETQWRHGERLTLDKGGHISMYPDLSGWNGSQPIFVGDAKYKNITGKSVPEDDLYQMLAYVTAMDLPGGLLVYAKDEAEERIYEVRNADKTVEVASLNLRGTPEDILGEVRRIAQRVKAHSYPAIYGRAA